MFQIQRTMQDVKVISVIYSLSLLCQNKGHKQSRDRSFSPSQNKTSFFCTFNVNLHSLQKINCSKFQFDEVITGYTISYIRLKLKENLFFLVQKLCLVCCADKGCDLCFSAGCSLVFDWRCW